MNYYAKISALICLLLSCAAVKEIHAKATYEYDFKAFSKFNPSTSTDGELDKLKFSNTEKWAKINYDAVLSKEYQKLFTVFSNGFTLQAPPLNSSERTKTELEYIKKLQKNVDQKLLDRIKAERVFFNVKFARHNFSDLFIDDQVQDRFPFLLAYFNQVRAIVFIYKNKFDRVRPAQLDKGIKTLISQPMHPAYPSGHSTEAHFVAAFLSYLDPDSKEDYFRAAYEIAKNREYAGLHYPSDSEAGKILGTAFFNFLLANETSRSNLENYKKFYIENKARLTEM